MRCVRAAGATAGCLFWALCAAACGIVGPDQMEYVAAWSDDDSRVAIVRVDATYFTSEFDGTEMLGSLAFSLYLEDPDDGTRTIIVEGADTLVYQEPFLPTLSHTASSGESLVQFPFGTFRVDGGGGVGPLPDFVDVVESRVRSATGVIVSVDEAGELQFTTDEPRATVPRAR